MYNAKSKTMSAKAKKEVQEFTLQVKRFVMRKSLVGQSAKIKFTTPKGVTYIYDHDAVYEANKEKFEAMPCWQKYKNYTSTNNVPVFARPFSTIVEETK